MSKLLSYGGAVLILFVPFLVEVIEHLTARRGLKGGLAELGGLLVTKRGASAIFSQGRKMCLPNFLAEI